MQVDDAPPQSKRYGVRSILSTQFAKDALHMSFHSSGSCSEQIPNLAIPETAGDESQNFYFAWGKRDLGEETDELFRNFLGDVPLSCVYGPNRTDHFCVHHLFQKVAPNTCLERTIYILVTVVRSQGNNASPRTVLPDFTGRFNSAFIRKPQIHQRDVGAVLAVQTDRACAIFSFRNKGQIRFSCNDGGHALPHEIVVIHG